VREGSNEKRNVKVKTYTDPELFLKSTQAELESHEAANSLMLGICGQLIQHPERLEARPCLKTVEDENRLMLAAVMTPPHKLVAWARQGDLDGIAGILVDDLVREGWRLPGLLGPGKTAQAIATQWAEATGNECALERRQSVYELRAVPGSALGPGRLRLATEQDAELVARWCHGFHSEIFGQAEHEASRRSAKDRIGDGDVYLFEVQRPVSVAMKSRPTRSGISISLVYTPPELRGRGHATACVGSLSRMLLKAGWKYCTLFVDQSNAAAKRVYQKIGYRPTCDYDEYVFGEIRA
jgi:predicted GNAT family acetyltransferase